MPRSGLDYGGVMPTAAGSEYTRRLQPATPTRSQTLKAALEYARRGWPVFPCRPGGKEPLIRDWPHEASTDPRRITAWWNRWPDANIGVVTGERSGVLALDVDHPPALAELEAARGELPATRTHATGSGGMHYLFSYPDTGERFGNSSGDLPEGLDVRGEGGYIVAPPSTTTRPYETLDELPLAPVPEWMLEALGEPQRAASGRGNRHSPAPIDQGAGGPIPQGRRNWTLYRRGCSLRARSHDHAEILEALVLENQERCEPPLEDLEVQRIAASAARHALGSATGEPDAETLELLERIAAALELVAWRGMAGKTDRDVMIALVKAARRYGQLIPAGVRVSLSVRDLALAAAISKPTAIKAIRRLREAALIRKDDGDRSGTEAGAFVLLPPRANLYHSTTPGGVEGREKPSGKDLRAPYTAPRLRWSAPEIRRLGKTRGAVVDHLEAAGGSVELSELAAALRVKRLRDFRRRVLPPLEAAGVVRVLGDAVALTPDWIEALNRDRERAGEIEALRRDMVHYDLEKEAYRNRHKVRPEPVPERLPTGEIRELERLPAVDAELVEALRSYLTRNPHRAGETASWLAVALWSENWLEGKSPPAYVEAARLELEGAAA